MVAGVLPLELLSSYPEAGSRSYQWQCKPEKLEGAMMIEVNARDVKTPSSHMRVNVVSCFCCLCQVLM